MKYLINFSKGLTFVVWCLFWVLFAPFWVPIVGLHDIGCDNPKDKLFFTLEY